MESYDFDPRLNCIVGRNGVGKTNLLDAIHYLAMCKSHFRLPDKNMIQHEKDFFRLEGHFSLDGKAETIVTKLPRGKRKTVERNGVPYKKLLEHIGLIPVVMIVPDDARLATGGSEERRRFVDTAISQMDRLYLEALARYQQCLKQRNATLKQMRQPANNTSARGLPFPHAENKGGANGDLLMAYTQQMAAPAQLIYEKRKQFLADWLPLFQQYYQRISGAAEEVGCWYRSQLSEGGFTALSKAAADRDRLLARTTVGIHKDDLLFEMGGHEVKKFASQGQLKSYVLAAKLALYDLLKKQKMQTPIFLLDDIFDKLDRHRVRHLLELLIEKDMGQVFITDTSENRVMELVEDFAVSCRQIVVND